MAKKRLNLYDKYSEDYSIPFFLMGSPKSKMDIAKEKSDRTKEVVGFDENYDASENTRGITEILGIQDKYDNRPTMPATGMTIPSSAYENTSPRGIEDLTGYDDQIMREAMKEKRDGEVEEEDEIKTGKGYDELGFFQKILKAATENPEATRELARTLLEGGGLAKGLVEFGEEKGEQDKAKAALAVEAEKTLYERGMEKAKFDLDVAKANALADYYGTTSKAALLKAEKLPKEVEAAQAYAFQMAGPNNLELFQEYFKEAFKMLAERSSSTQLPDVFGMPGQEGGETDAVENAIDVATRTQNELQN